MFQLYMLIIILVLPTIIMTVAYTGISRKILKFSKSQDRFDRWPCSLEFDFNKSYSVRYTSRKDLPILTLSEPYLVERQIHNELKNENIDNQERIKETKFLKRFTTIHQSFVGRKPLSRGRKTSQSLPGSKSRPYKTRANYSRGKPSIEHLLRTSSNNNREQMNQSQVRKVWRTKIKIEALKKSSSGCSYAGDGGYCFHFLLDPDTYLWSFAIFQYHWYSSIQKYQACQDLLQSSGIWQQGSSTIHL